MTERLYKFRHDQVAFETGLAQGKQVLIANTIHTIFAHWFDLEGRFLELEQFPMAVDPPTFPGTTIYQTGSEYYVAVDAEMAALKERIGFQPADIRVHKFVSPEAEIADLPYEYEQFLESPESAAEDDREHLPQSIADWRAEGRFVLYWCVDYWMAEDGSVLSHG